jgi:hypothetical protein
MPFACLGGLSDQHAIMDFASFRKGRPREAPRIVAPIDGGLGDRPHLHRLRPERPHQVTRPRKSVRLWYRNGRIGRPRRAGYARCSDAVPYHIATSRLIEHVGRPEIASPQAVESDDPSIVEPLASARDVRTQPLQSHR